MIKILGALILMAILSTSCGAVPSDLPKLAVPDSLGVNIHFMGREQKQVDQIADAGFRFIRMDFSWVHIEKKKGEYDFAPYDELVSSLASRNIRALFILDYGNPLYDNDMAPHTDEGRAAFTAFAKAAAAHFKGKGILWEIWNEPNGGFWRPQANVEDYVKLCKQVYPAIKAVDPDATVLAPALAGWDFGFIEKACELGMLECTDVISLHAYGAAKPEDAAVYFNKVRDIVAKYASKGRTYPIVSGEWGYSCFSKGIPIERQGEFIARCFISNMMNGCPLSIWYDWHDDGPNPDENEHHFGTVLQDFTPKPAYNAVKTLSTELECYAFVRRMQLDSDEDYQVLFSKDDDYRMAVWTTDKPHKVTILADVPAVNVVSLLGEKRRIETKDGAFDIQLTGAVQYIEPETPSKRWALEAAWDVSAAAALDNDGLSVQVNSLLDGKPTKDDQLEVTGDGIKSADNSIKYISSGQSKAKVKITLLAQGIDHPLVRVIELDTSVVPTVEVLPPVGRDILIAINRPASGSKNAFKGTLLLGNVDGIRLEKESTPIYLPANQDHVVYKFRSTQQPAGMFSFACKLTGEGGANVVRVPAKRYSVVASFADGKIGSDANGYRMELDGDPKVPAQAKLTYAKAPGVAPTDICAQLDYSFDAGWRFIKISQMSRIPIPDKPSTLKVWVKGDGGTAAARTRIDDASGQTFQPDLGAMNFTDWRCMEADLTCAHCGHWGGKDDGQVHYPIAWNTLFLLDNVGAMARKGTIYIGPAMICYD